MPGDRFLAPGLRIVPNGIIGAFANWNATVLLKMAQQGPPLSCQHQLRRLRVGIEPENFFAFDVQQQLNGFLEVA